MSANKKRQTKTLSDPIRIETPDALIVIVPILAEQAYLNTATCEDIKQAQLFNNTNRRASFLAWRSAARAEIGNKRISYNDIGAPIISDDPLNIGVSHSASAAAIILSHKRCAIDIETSERDFSRASTRFLSPSEASMTAAQHPLFLATLWCAKETLYKISGCNKLNLLTDLTLTTIDFEANYAIGKIKEPNGVYTQYKITILQFDNIIGTFIAE